MKRVHDIVLLTDAADAQSAVLRLALSGNIFCRAQTAEDVRELVQCFAPEPDYDACYIQATYCSGETEMIAPVRDRWELTTLSLSTMNNMQLAAA